MYKSKPSNIRKNLLYLYNFSHLIENFILFNLQYNIFT